MRCLLILTTYILYILMSEYLFFSDGILLPDNHRQLLHTNGTLIIRDLSRETDEGKYEL